MDPIDYWRFCDELNVVQAALLIVGQDPSEAERYVDDWEPYQQPKGYIAVLSALQHAILSKRLDGEIVYLPLDYQHPNANHPIHSVNWHASRVYVELLKLWLEEKEIRSGFFFPERLALTDYLDTKDECYSPKLAAAVSAWQAVKAQRAAQQSARSVKQDVAHWLNTHADEYGLANDDGEPVKQAVENVATVVNWDTRGGAPRTPQPIPAGSSEPPY